MRDDNQDDDLEQPSTEGQPSPDSPVEPSEPDEVEYPVDRLRNRLNQTLGGRPIIVYLVLLAGVATLLLLLAIVWISASGPGSDNRPFCTPIGSSDAQNAILAGEVEQINILVGQQDPLQSLTGMRLELVDGSCRQPAQGADARNDLYFILGVADFYNTFGEQRVKISYQRQDIPSELLATSTPTPTATVPPTETPTTGPTVQPTETVYPQPSETPTATPTTAATPVVVVPASPGPASPMASPARTATQTATASPLP
jgi:hypothetical protein